MQLCNQTRDALVSFHSSKIKYLATKMHKPVHYSPNKQGGFYSKSRQINGVDHDRRKRKETLKESKEVNILYHKSDAVFFKKTRSHTCEVKKLGLENKKP